jgi:hypothetical protein
MGSTQASMTEGRNSRRTSQRAQAVLVLLIALASTLAACSSAGGGTVYPAGSCEHFVTTVRASERSYAPGQTVIISVTQVNEGPTCYGIPPEWCGNLQAFASAYNSAGEDIWDSGASKTIPGNNTCPFAAAPGPGWPAQYSNTEELDWSQDNCALDDTGQPGQANPDCPGTPVPAGRYRIVGNSTAASITITISS